MTQGETIEMARQAGFSLGHNVTEEYSKKLEAFAKLVDAKATAKERDAIIDLVAMYGGPVDLEAAIRARGDA